MSLEKNTHSLPGWKIYLFIFAIETILSVSICVFVGPRGWDDGAITLAFSKTFAETGRVALTAVSEQVEGFSSVSWFLLNSVVAVFRPTFNEAILFSQILSAASLAIGTLFLFLIARSLKLKNSSIAAILFMFAMLGQSVVEISNGMEMTLLAASGLAIIYALYFERKSLLLYISIIVFLTTRFEASFYYVFLLMPLIFRREYRKFISLGMLGLGILFLQEIARYIMFGEILPNTIYAKAHPPYTIYKFLPMVYSHVYAPVEILAVMFPLALLIFVFVTRDWILKRGISRLASINRETIIILLTPIIATALFAFVTGKNMGYAGRMQYLSIPFTLLIFAILFDLYTVNLCKSTVRYILICITLVTISFSYYTSGVAMRRIIGPRLDWVKNDTELGVSPARYKLIGNDIEYLQNLVGLKRIVFATPDVGGVGLCCRSIRVVDIGMLTNRRLAKYGYSAMPFVLEEERPDVIESHGGWSSNSRLYELSFFKNNYQPATIDKTRFFIRRDLVYKLLSQHDAVWCQIKDSGCITMAFGHSYIITYSLDDDEFFASDKILIVKNGTESYHNWSDR